MLFVGMCASSDDIAFAQYFSLTMYKPKQVQENFPFVNFVVFVDSILQPIAFFRLKSRLTSNQQMLQLDIQILFCQNQ